VPASSLPTLIKQPAERRTARVAFSLPAGVTLLSLVAAAAVAAGRVAEVAPLTIGTVVLGPDYVLAPLTGGTAGEVYALTALADASNGDRIEAQLEVLVLDLALRAGSVPDTRYLTLEGFVARAGVEATVRLTDEDGTGAIDARRLEAAIRDAEAIVDSYLSARYAVPLAAPVPDLVPGLAFALAHARLWRGELPATVAAQAKAAETTLRDLADGRAALALVAPPADSPSPILVQPGLRRRRAVV
jgi:phage gp36-like protein